MPKAVKPTHKRSRPSHSSLPRRFQGHSERERYRREMLPGPGPIDCWLCANCSPERAMEQPLVEGEVRCTVVVQLEKAAQDDSPFVNPDTYSLHLTVATFTPPGKPQNASLLAGVLARYEGFNYGLDVPDWTRRKPGREMIFRQTVKELATFLSRVASNRTDVRTLVMGLEAMSI